MEQGTDVALPGKASPDCLTVSPSNPSSDGDAPEGVAQGGTDCPARVKGPAPESAGVEHVGSGVLGVCTVLGSTGFNQGGQCGVGSGGEGAVVPSDRAAEGSDSVDWEVVRLAPRFKVEITSTNHADC